jgi:hypothetical protein
VTQVADVAVKSAGKKPQEVPLRDAIGRVSSTAPSRMIPAKTRAMICVGLIRKRRFFSVARTGAVVFFTATDLLSKGTNFTNTILYRFSFALQGVFLLPMFPKGFLAFLHKFFPSFLVLHLFMAMVS